jgi:hypothetical protein
LPADVHTTPRRLQQQATPGHKAAPRHTCHRNNCTCTQSGSVVGKGHAAAAALLGGSRQQQHQQAAIQRGAPPSDIHATRAQRSGYVARPASWLRCQQHPLCCSWRQGGRPAGGCAACCCLPDSWLPRVVGAGLLPKERRKGTMHHTCYSRYVHPRTKTQGRSADTCTGVPVHCSSCCCRSVLTAPANSQAAANRLTCW